MTTLNASDTRIPPAAFNEVVYQGERVRIQRRGGDSVYLISAEDLVVLEKLEDRYWAEEGLAALREFDASGRKAIPWEQTKRKMKRR